MDVNDSRFEENVLNELNDLESDFSDEEDQNVEVNAALESEHDTTSEVEASDDERESQDQNDDRFFISRNNFRWSKVEPRRNVRNPAHNILRIGNRRCLQNQNEVNVWDTFFTEDMLNIILEWTNKKLHDLRTRFNKNITELNDIDIVELRALIGFLLFTAIFKSNRENVDALFATDGTGREIFRLIMSKKRFLTLLAVLRFDNPETRRERRADDKAAAIAELFDLFIQNCQYNYSVGSNACIDEMLVSFRGRCAFKMFMPKKPDKYGIKLMCVTDAQTNYLFNAYVYSGRDSDGNGLSNEEKTFPKPTQATIRLVRPLYGSNRNITGDNWFSSIELVKKLKDNGLTYVGTLNKRKREIPGEFQPHRTRRVGESLYGFTNSITLLSYVPKRNRAVILLSSMHHTIEIDQDNNLPEIIAYYNSTKNGVDGLDRMCNTYSCIRRTKRWPMVLFYRIIDICAVNAFIFYQSQTVHEDFRRLDYLKRVAMELLSAHVKRRFYNTRISRDLRSGIKRVFKIVDEEVRDDPSTSRMEQRKTCIICPSKKKKRTSYLCNQCKKPACLDCLKKICTTCFE